VNEETLRIFVTENTSATSRDGSFSVSGGGISDTYQISQKAHLKADFSYTMQTSMGRAMVYFSDQSSGSPTSIEWDFHNDGTIDSTLENPSQTFREGEYEVKFTVHKDGESDSIVKTIRVVIQQ
jgi:PKD repeat protein